MKFAHNIKISVFVHEGEDAVMIEDKLRSLVPFDLEEQKLELTKIVASGAKDNHIIIFEIYLDKQVHISRFIKNLLANLSADQKDLILRQAPSRLDSELNFFIRLDKTRLLEKDQCWVTDSGNCFHIRMAIAAYPAKRDAGLAVLARMLSSGSD
jgi:RNA binding exosome subunit